MKILCSATRFESVDATSTIMRESVRPGTDDGDFVIVEKSAVFGRLKAPFTQARSEIMASIASQEALLSQIIEANSGQYSLYFVSYDTFSFITLLMCFFVFI